MFNGGKIESIQNDILTIKENQKILSDNDKVLCERIERKASKKEISDYTDRLSELEKKFDLILKHLGLRYERDAQYLPFVGLNITNRRLEKIKKCRECTSKNLGRTPGSR
jgi:hypothetical protein